MRAASVKGLAERRCNHEVHGRHVGTRTPDLYRVNFEVNDLKPFPHLAFPHCLTLQNAPKQLSFDGELMACLVPTWLQDYW